MNKKELEDLLKGNLVKIRNKYNEVIGAIQLDLEYDKFLAMYSIGKIKNNEYDFMPVNLWDSLHEAINEVEEFSE